jgi:hypothetical protein
MDYGYFSPYLSLVVSGLLIVTLLLAALAFYNLKEIRRDLKGFLDVEKEWRSAAALERETLADALRKERQKERDDFLLHTHDETGKVVL